MFHFTCNHGLTCYTCYLSICINSLKFENMRRKNNIFQLKCKIYIHGSDSKYKRKIVCIIELNKNFKKRSLATGKFE